jgi:hypothetical protein
MIVMANPHKVTLCIPKDATVERVIEVFKKRTGIAGRWEGRVTSDLAPRVVGIAPVVAPAVPCGQKKP